MDGIKAASINGDKSQVLAKKPSTILNQSKNATLIATDVAAVASIFSSLIGGELRYTCLEAEDYVHRIGRTGRARIVALQFLL